MSLVADLAALSLYTRVVHSDWSISLRKRWAATAIRSEAGWVTSAPCRVGDTGLFLNYLMDGSHTTLAGFDFPIGLPEFYGQKSQLGDFCDALDAFGSGPWSDFYNVAEAADEISIFRPFYPQRSASGSRRIHLIEAHQCGSFDHLLRQCERPTAARRAACPLFWTLGSNQVGKAAISGWKEIVSPARRLGAKLWPFDGSLRRLANIGELVLAETYPAEAYGHVGISLATGESKRRQNDRAKIAVSALKWADSNKVILTPTLVSLIKNGFGSRADGEDSFDALLGLFGMIEVMDGRRPEGPMHKGNWEGWILGQSE